MSRFLLNRVLMHSKLGSDYFYQIEYAIAFPMHSTDNLRNQRGIEQRSPSPKSQQDQVQCNSPVVLCVREVS